MLKEKPNKKILKGESNGSPFFWSNLLYPYVKFFKYIRQEAVML